MIEHLTKVKNILMIPKAYLREKKHNTKVVRDIVLFLMILCEDDSYVFDVDLNTTNHEVTEHESY